MYLGIVNTVVNIAEPVLFISDKLMAGIQVAPGSYRHIFGTRAAARNTLVDARTRSEVEHVVVECDGFALFFAPKHILSEYFVLLKKDWKIVICKRVGIIGSAHNWLH